jgi:hypothetical protein
MREANGDGGKKCGCQVGLRSHARIWRAGAGDYWGQLTQRGERDRGSAVGVLGAEGALSSRASVFVEGGYGMGLRRGAEGELLTRITGRVGFRLRL